MDKPEKLDPRDQAERVAGYLKKLSGDRFFGQVTVKMIEGNIVQVVTEQSHKPETLPQE